MIGYAKDAARCSAEKGAAYFMWIDLYIKDITFIFSAPLEQLGSSASKKGFKPTPSMQLTPTLLTKVASF